MTDLDELVDAYFDAKKKVLEAFGYVTDWVEIPLEDLRGEHWMLVGGEGVGGSYVHSPKPFTKKSIEEGKEISGGPIYTQRFLKKWVYRTETHVLVAADTQTDGNKFLYVFDADKECVSEEFRTLYREHWG